MVWVVRSSVPHKRGERPTIASFPSNFPRSGARRPQPRSAFHAGPQDVQGRLLHGADVLARPGPVLSRSNRVLTLRRILRCTTAGSPPSGGDRSEWKELPVHPNLIAALAEDRRKSCPCGAVTGQPCGLCRKCLARMVWRRRTSRPARRAVRRRADRPARDRAWVFAVAASMLRTIGKGAKS